MRHLLIQVASVLFAGGLTAQQLPVPYISAEALEADLQMLYRWVQDLHPRHEALDSASFMAFAARFPSGAPTFFAASVIDEALQPLADEHTSVHVAMWSALVAETHGVWEGSVEVVNEAGDLIWMDASGLEVDSLYAKPVATLSPNALLQGLWPELHPATRANQVAAIAPMWAPFLATAEGKSPQDALPSNSNLRWNWDEGRRSFRITAPSFTHASDADFEAQIAEIQKALEDISSESDALWVVDLRGNGGGHCERAMMIASLFTEQPVQFHHSVHLQGSQALRELGRAQVPWWKRPVATPYDRAVLKTNAGELASIRARTLPASESLVPTGGEIQVLVDGLTGSAAAGLALWLQNECNASLVGIPPYAQTQAVCGNTLTFHLPNSAIPVRIATTCWTATPSLFPARVAMTVDSMVFPGPRPVERLRAEFPRDHAFLLGLKVEMADLLPDAAKFEDLAAPIVLSCAELLKQNDEEQRKLERLPMGSMTAAGLEPAEAMNELLRLKKDAIDQRNAELRLLVPMHLWPTMNAWLNPQKPAVLHFGLHDRMNCNVCKPE